MRLRYLLVVLAVAAALLAASSAGAGTVCTGDVCVVISGGFAGLRADIASAGAPAPVARLLTREVSLAEVLHPPDPCFTGLIPPGPSCLARYLPSEYLLVLVDFQVRSLAGLGGPAPACAGCTFPPDAARLVDADIRAMFADRSIFPPGPPTLPVYPPGPPS
ncbi:MAG: hypothetical protein ACYDCH_05205 [Gaiellaceae bacterium]